MEIQCSWLAGLSTYYTTPNGGFTTTIPNSNFSSIVAPAVAAKGTPRSITVTAFGPNGVSDRKVIDLLIDPRP